MNQRVQTRIRLGPCRSADVELAAALRGRLERLFGVPCVVDGALASAVPPSERRDSGDLRAIAKALPQIADGDKMLVLTPQRLVSGSGLAVWGAAELGGYRALLSLAPFGIANGPPNQWRHVFRDVLREAAHELGHLFGLDHCPTRGCIMQVRPARDKDDGVVRFCAECKARLRLAPRKRDRAPVSR